MGHDNLDFLLTLRLIITFGGDTLPESPVTTNSSGGFSLTFVVPGESSSGPKPVVSTVGIRIGSLKNVYSDRGLAILHY